MIHFQPFPLRGPPLRSLLTEAAAVPARTPSGADRIVDAVGGLAVPAAGVVGFRGILVLTGCTGIVVKADIYQQVESTISAKDRRWDVRNCTNEY